MPTFVEVLFKNKSVMGCGQAHAFHSFERIYLACNWSSELGGAWFIVLMRTSLMIFLSLD